MRNTPKTQSRNHRSVLQAVTDWFISEPEDDIHVRFMCGSDMASTAEIERECFGYESWTEDELIGNLTSRLCVAKVAIRRNRVVGYMAYKLNSGQVELVRIAVHPSARRHHVGSHLVGHLKEKLENKHFQSVRADVPDDCLGVQLLLKKSGFRATEILKEKSGEYYRMIYKKQKQESKKWQD